MAKGKVYLVGAGPGDPGLITLRAVELLQRADAVLYDYLVNPQILRHCRSDATLVSLGKHGSGRVLTQSEINERLTTLADVFTTVVRLKSGDPMVFARAGEELDCLVNNKIPFEVVPGVTAALAAASYAGIPITHREVNSTVTFVTGHDASGVVPDAVDWAALAKGSPVIVAYMALKHLASIADRLLAAGRPADEPVAVVSRATTPQQRVLETTLARCAADAAADGIEPPSIVAFGRVVTLRAGLDWLGALGGRVLDPEPLGRAGERETG